MAFSAPPVDAMAASSEGSGSTACATVVLPALAIQTSHSPGEGLHDPDVWWPQLATWHRLPGHPDPLPCRLLVADRTLAGLPAACAAWGRERLAIGALIRLPLPTASEPDVLVLAPTEQAYGRLCRLLSRIAETPQRIAAWLGSGLGPPDRRQEPPLGGVIILVRDHSLGRTLEDAGAEVLWRCQDVPDGPDVAMTSAEMTWPRVWLPIVSLLTADERAGAPIRLGIARRSPTSVVNDRHELRSLALDEVATTAQRFADEPALIWRSHALLSRCTYVPGGTWHMPPSRYGDDADRVLAERALTGAAKRYGTPLAPVVQARLTHELTVITRKSFAGYLLTVADLAHGRRTCGRGSGASSVVVYCLGITNVDPIRWNLLFERFLSESRIDPPDLDVDFPWDERDAVFTHALAVYGPAHVAMVSVHVRLRRDGALRAVARAWGVADAETSAIAQGLRGQRRFGHHQELPEPWPALLADAAAVEGMHLYDGLHCGGLIITGPPIRDLVPVHPAAKLIDMATKRWEEPAWEPVPAIAWEKNGAEDMGLVKIDILGNRSLAVIRDVLADLAVAGHAIDEATWNPTEDAATGDLVARGATMGCFYIESPAMRQLQAKAGSGDFDRLVVHSSIIRPAANRWIQTYLERLHHVRRTGQHRDAWYPAPVLRGLLSETYGVLSYQEDVMLVAREVAGFDEAGSNGLRKALGHWDTQQRLLRYAEAFLSGAAANGIAPAVAQEIWGNISSFAGYSFAKAHSASYAMVSFQAAYLKQHAPAAFHARVIANEGGFYSAAAYVEEARRLGIEIRGPSIRFSQWKTAPEGLGALRLGWHLVPRISRSTAELIAAEQAVAPFTGIGDLARRGRLDARTLLVLAQVGALADLRPDLHHAQIRWLAQTVGLGRVRQGHARSAAPMRARAAEGHEQWIFPPPVWVDPAVPALRPWSAAAVAWERYQVLGICVEHHPLGFVVRPAAWCARDINQAEHGAWVALVGVVVTSKRVSATSRDGAPKPMCFATLEDETALVEAVLFPEAYRRAGGAISGKQPLLVRGQVQVEFGQRSLHVHTVEVVEWTPILGKMMSTV